MNKFYTNGYVVKRQLITTEEVKVLAKLMKKSFKSGESFEDTQVIGSFRFNQFKEFDDLQIKLLPKLEKIVKLKLFKTYYYARLHKNGNVLRRHTDRSACEISATIDLGGEPWDIWILKENGGNPIKIQLAPGDALIYRGIDMIHWRNEFEGKIHLQIFMHYVDQNGQYTWCKDDKHPELKGL